MAVRPLRPATDHRLGRLLPYQLPNQPRATPSAKISFLSRAYAVLPSVSRSYPPQTVMFPRVTHPSATGLLLIPFDLHVLSVPPAFVLSQDQTLKLKPTVPSRPPSLIFISDARSDMYATLFFAAYISLLFCFSLLLQ